MNKNMNSPSKLTEFAPLSPEESQPVVASLFSRFFNFARSQYLLTTVRYLFNQFTIICLINFGEGYVTVSMYHMYIDAQICMVHVNLYTCQCI